MTVPVSEKYKTCGYKAIIVYPCFGYQAVWQYPNQFIFNYKFFLNYLIYDKYHENMISWGQVKKKTESFCFE